LPPGWDAQEPALREIAGRVVRRGNITANLNIRRERATQLVADPSVLEQILALVNELAQRLPGSPPPRIEALLALPGVLRVATATEAEPEPAGTAPGIIAAIIAAIIAGFETALAELVSGRRSEGERLATLLSAQMEELSALHDQACREAADQPAQQRARMMVSLQTLLRDSPGLPEERIAQEVALLASRSDVREELDRLSSHITAARALLAEGVSIGRRFDFLVQEFNREANTLCSKSASIALTAIGLRVKTVIEQVREQVQNIE
jgi:uncharacterized protein (TIGR00255 family)